jgi:hypothetical protein
MEFDNIKMVQQPPDLKINLFPHQLASIYRMENLESNNILYKENYIKETKIGVNADLLGFGKTLAMVGLILRDKMEWDLELPFVFKKTEINAKGRIQTHYITRFDKLPTTLILVTKNIIGQWESELSHTPLKFKSIITKKDTDTTIVEEYDVILTVPEMFNNLMSTNSGYAWKRFIFDEPGNLKVIGMKEIYANFYWFITSIPNSISNFHRNCKGSFMKDIINNSWTDFETQFSDVIIRNNPEFVRNSFNMPQTFHYTHECYQPIFNALKNFVTPNIKTMIEAGNIEGAIISLGGKKTDNIIDIVKVNKQEQLIIVNSKIELYTLRDDKQNLNEWLDRKKHIMIQIEEIDKKFQDILSDSCPICLESFKNPVLEINCQNLFCGKCLFKCIEMNNSCPICRVEIDISKLIYITNNSEKTNNKKNDTKMTKLNKIVDIINVNKTGKFLIFSEHNESFQQISNILKENNILFLQIKGNINTRKKNIDMFKDGKVPVIFLNSNIECAGLNLQETTDIILYHKMNTDIESQILGRANRIGRKISLNVHHLL